MTDQKQTDAAAAIEEPTKSHRRTQSQVVSSAGSGSIKENSIIDIIPQQQQSDEIAIKLATAHKHYGSGKSKLPVLMGLNMEVGRGQIYGLLGMHTFTFK